jgi:hypothetical protein
VKKGTRIVITVFLRSTQLKVGRHRIFDSSIWNQELDRVCGDSPADKRPSRAADEIHWSESEHDLLVSINIEFDRQGVGVHLRRSTCVSREGVLAKVRRWGSGIKRLKALRKT